MSAVVQTKAGLSVESRTALMDWPYFLGATRRTYDVSLDGQRFLVIAQAQRTAYGDGQLIVVENWFTELQQRVPTR